MPELEIALLGAFQVRLAGKLVPNPPTKKAQALLAYLAVEAATVHARERLALLLWPDQPREQAFDSLRQSLHLVRKIIPPAYLHATRTDVQFAEPSAYHLDVTVFRHLITTCQRHASTHASPCTACQEQLHQAASLYRGDFLQHFVLPECDGFEAWVLLQREWLQRAALTTFFHLAEQHIQQGDYEPARHWAWRQIEVDPPREEAHRQLIRILALQGQRSAALAQYESCRRILAEVVDAAPAVATTALYEQIRNGDFFDKASPVRVTRRSASSAESWQDDKAGLLRQPITQSTIGQAQGKPSHPIPLPPHNLPAALTPLLGREAECSEVLHLLADPAMRLLTLLGPGGIGKSHLALEVAHRALSLAPNLAHAHPSHAAAQFGDGVYLVELAPLSSVAAIATATAEALQLALAAGRSPQQQLCDHLRQRQLLLVLDNFEHLLDGVDLVMAWLQAAPGLKIMVTSRVRLQVQSEQLFPLEGLAYPETGIESLAILADYSAVQLFVQQARRAHRHFAPPAEDWRATAQICRLLQGMPLGILLAAAWVELYAPVEIASQIAHNLDFLTSDWRALPTRHQSMRAIFAHTWGLLSQREQIIFPQLAIFCGGFTPAAAQAVTAATPHDLLALVERALVRRHQTADGASRFDLHELVRQFATEKLTAEETLHTIARDRHAVYYADFLQEQHKAMGTPQQAAALVAVDGEAENVRAAWDWAVAQGQMARLQQMLAGLNHYYHTRQYHQAAETALGAAIEKLEIQLSTLPASPASELHLLERLLTHQGMYAWKREDFVCAEQFFRRSLAVLEKVSALGEETRKDQAYLLRELGRLAMRTDPPAAQQFFEQSLALYQALGHRWGGVQVLAFLGELALNMGDLAVARQRLEKGLHWQAGLTDLEIRASLLTLLGDVALQQGQWAQAEEWQRAALGLVQSIGGAPDHELLHLGMTLVWSGKFAEGQAALGERIGLDQGKRRDTALAAAFATLSQAEVHLGSYAQARSSAQTSLRILREHDDPRHSGAALLAAGQVALAEGAYAVAAGTLHEGVRILRANNQPIALALTLACLGYTAQRLADGKRAQQYLTEATQIAVKAGAVLPWLVALPGWALQKLDQEEPANAIELYTLALQYPFVANSRWFADVAGRQIASLIAPLPTTLIETAQARGRTAELWQSAADILRKPG